METQAACTTGEEEPLNRNTGPDVIDLIVGLDFGTAATKVVIRSPYLPGERARAISFGELGHTSSPYLVPTRLHCGADGGLRLQGELGGAWTTNLKTALLDGGNQQAQIGIADSLVRAAAYLALVLREARERFLRLERETYRRFKIRWAVNVGIPSADYDDGGVHKIFLRAARVAWKLSWKGPLTWDLVSAAFGELDKPVDDDETPIAVIPEVVAQAVGYARSPLRDPGLHVLVDIGASTLDVCGFFLRPAQGQDCYDLLTATVDRLGVVELHRQRISALHCPENIQKLQNLDPLNPFPEMLSNYHPGCSCGADDVDGKFGSRVTQVLTRHLAELKKTRDPYSERWRTGLPVFLCGGGSAMQLFRFAAQEADKEFRKVMIAEPVHLRPLPKPTNLVNSDIGDGVYHRLSVAYGLSFEAFNIGSVTPPRELVDIVPELSRKDYEARYVSKNEV